MYEKLNKQKAIYENKMTLGYVITGLAFVLYIPLGFAIGPLAFFLIAIPFLGGGIYAGMNSKKIKEMSNEFKKVYVTQELKKIFPNSRYEFDQGFSEEEVVESKLLFNRDRYSSEDLITAEFDGVNFRCSDVTQKEVRSNGKHSTVVTVFKGRFYEFDFPKDFMYNLLLLQPMNYRPFSNFKKVKLESINFNSEIKVYAQDEHEAFYILTPQFMEKILYMDQKYFDKISFSFLDNKLYIAIDTRKDYFDIKPYKIVDDSIITEYKEELNDIKEFILELKLNQSLFKK